MVLLLPSTKLTGKHGVSGRIVVRDTGEAAT
jgi:hypothetical protein